MRTVIVGCGRVGAMLAVMLDDGGHNVTVLDISTGAFDRLPSTFKGNALRGDGTDEDTLRRAGAEDADLFLAMTEGDNRNIMAAQLAAEAFRVGQVIAKINDPLRALAYAELGIATICRTDLMANAILSYLKLPVSVVPGVRSSTGHHRHEPEDGPAGPAAGAGGDGAADLIAGLAEAGIPIRTLDASTPPADPAEPASVPGSASSSVAGSAAASGSVKVEG
jgi:trk system potassium uptake protein